MWDAPSSEISALPNVASSAVQPTAMCEPAAATESLGIAAVTPSCTQIAYASPSLDAATPRHDQRRRETVPHACQSNRGMVLA
jgi:hypothetical protein